ncbi:hypothetical protein [Flavobacterium sp.]|jgi:hypothetical protein|uniref:hypothetical protein n=1 Tax=Flavobacterium sp. TaxID=239 RepID=UPI0037C0FC06
MTLQQVRDKFIDTITESRDLYTHCLSPVGLHTDSGVEAAFIQLHKNWEVFLEEILVCLLNGQTVINGNPITPKLTIADRNLVRTIIYQDKNYIEWTDETIIKKRFERHLDVPNRIIDTLNTISIELKDITKVRNFIAHSSGTAKEKYENLVRSRLGGNPNTTRASFFLKSTDRDDANQTYFDKYIGTLEIAAENMIGA